MQLSKNRCLIWNDVAKPDKICGADRDRTDDPRLAKAMLSQLSYSPEKDSR